MTSLSCSSPPSASWDDCFDQLFSRALFEFRQIRKLKAGGQKSDATVTGPGSGCLVTCSDGSVKYDLRAYPAGPGLFGYTHPVILKNSLKATLMSRQLASEEEREELYRQKKEVWDACSDRERKILGANFPGPLFMENDDPPNLSYHHYLVGRGLMTLLQKGPFLGERGRIAEIASWTKEYRGNWKSDNLTVRYKKTSENRLFVAGIISDDGELHFPLSLHKKQMQEIFQILSKIL